MIIIGIFVLFFAVIGCLINYGNQYTEYRYLLSEMSDGVYAIYYNTHSRVPAENYEVVTICCESNVYTFKGDINISFTDEEPYLYAKKFNLVNSDEIHIYIPQDTLVYEESVNIGR